MPSLTCFESDLLRQAAVLHLNVDLLQHCGDTHHVCSAISCCLSESHTCVTRLLMHDP